MVEGKIQKDILAYLHTIRICAWRNNSGTVRVRGGYMHLAPEGTPDILGYMPDGRLLGIEVKQPKEEPTEKQVLWMEKAIKAGCLVFVAHSLDDAIQEIERGEREHFTFNLELLWFCYKFA